MQGECNDAADYAKSSSFSIPQYFFDDGIDRYHDLIQQQLDVIRNHQFSDRSFSLDKCKYGTLHASQLHNRVLQINSLALRIAEDNSIHMTFTASVSGQCPGEAAYGIHINLLFTDFCITLDSCSGQMTYSSTIQFDVKIGLSVDPQKCGLNLQASVATAKIVSQSLDGCSVPHWLESILSAFGFDIQQQINAAVEALAEELITSLSGSFYLPQEVALANNVFIAYEVSKLAVIPDKQILVYVDTRLRAILPGSSQSVPYHDTTFPDRFNLRPWDNYSFHVTPDQYITSEARISDEVLHAYLWAYQEAGFKSSYGSIKILDANITVNLTWNTLDFTIPDTDLMVVSMDFGTITGKCGQKILIEVKFSNLTGTAQLRTTVNSAGDTGIYLQVVAWYQHSLNITLIQPAIMLPESFIQDFVRSAMNSCINDINTLLSENILYLPSSIAPYAPNQQVEIINQPGCCNNRHGFLQLSIRCTCSGDTHFKPCSHICGTSLDKRRGIDGFNAVDARDSSVGLTNSTSLLLTSPSFPSLQPDHPHSSLQWQPSSPEHILAAQALISHSAHSLDLLRDLKHENVALESLEQPKKKVPYPETILIVYNSDGSQSVSSSTMFYSYFAEGECILTPLGFYERIEISMDTNTGRKSANINSVCPNRTCTGCFAKGHNIPFDVSSRLGAGSILIETMPDCLNLDQINSVATGGGPDDNDEPIPDYTKCFWIVFHDILGPLSSHVLVCDVCQQYYLGNTSKFIVSSSTEALLGCPSCNATKNCTASLPRQHDGTCIKSGWGDSYRFAGPNPSACLVHYGCPVPFRVNTDLAVTVSVVSFCSLVLLILLYWRRKWVAQRGRALQHWSKEKGSIGMAKMRRAGVATKMFFFYLKRNEGLWGGEIQYALYASTIAQLAHMGAYIALQPLDIFGTQNLNELGFDSKYIVLDRYENAFVTWKHVALYTFIASTSLTAFVASSRIFFMIHTMVLRLATFLPMLSFMNAYLIYPTLISFKYLISINPSSNPYMNEHPDTVSSFQNMLGNGLSGIAVAFLTNQSLLIFSGFAIGALASGWLQFKHENLVVDTFLSIFCAMIPFVVMIPMLVLYHAISDHSIVWVLGWVDLMAGLICGIGFLYLKVHDAQFRVKAVVHQHFSPPYMIFGTLFLVSCLIFMCATLYVESAYELVSAWYLFAMIAAAAVMSFTFSFIMRSTKAFIIHPGKQDLPVKLFHNPREYIALETTEQQEEKRARELGVRKSWFQLLTFGVFDSEESFRFFCLVLGIPLMIYVVVNDYRIYESTTARDIFANFVDEYGSNGTDKLVWPPGKTILDPCFEQYDYVRMLQMWFLFFSAVFYTLGGLTHVVFHLKKRANRIQWLRASEILMFIGVLFTVACVVVVSTPDYISLIDLHSIVPTCGPDFDRFVSSSVNLGVGLVQTLISVLQTAGIIISFLPTFNRVLYTRIRMLRLRELPSAYLSIKEMYLRNICVGISFMSVFITALPLLVLRQISEDNDTAPLVLATFSFWLIPGLWLKGMIRLDNPAIWYVGYIFIYLSCALGILAAVMRDQLNAFLRTYLTDPIFYLAVVSSICISSVVIGDALRLMFGDFDLFDRFAEEIHVDREDDDDVDGVFGPDEETKRLLSNLYIN